MPKPAARDSTQVFLASPILTGRSVIPGVVDAAPSRLTAGMAAKANFNLFNRISGFLMAFPHAA